MSKTEAEIPYYTLGSLIPDVKLRWAQGCSLLDSSHYPLSMSRTPPPLRDRPPPVVSEPAPVRREERPRKEGILGAFDRPGAPSPPKPIPALIERPSQPVVKPFDLQDIPQALDSIGWPMSARVMRKWFSGELNYATTDEGARIGINQDGQPFPASMIDTSMFSLTWILRFKRAKAAYLRLRETEIYTEPAIRGIKRILRRQVVSPYFMNAWKLCGEEMQRYHREFQFQRVIVDGDFPSKLSMFFKGAAWPHGHFMDDLYGSLGAFSLNAAIDGFYLSRRSARRIRAEISQISIYMRDVFTFHDRTGAHLNGRIAKGSQYLGHWNKRGFIVVPVAVAAGEVQAADWLMRPVARSGIVNERYVYYPVRNRDYRDWQLRHRQGGDLILYSDRQVIHFLPDPFVVEFDL